MTEMFVATSSASSYSVKLHDLGQRITQITLKSANSSTMLGGIAEAIVERLPGDSCLMMVGTGGSGTFAILKQQGSPYQKLTSHQSKRLFKDPIVKRLLRDKRIVAVNNILAEQQNSDKGILVKLLSLRSFLAIPTLFRDQVNGVILLGNSSAHQWQFLEKELLRGSAESVAIAYSLAQLEQPTLSAPPSKKNTINNLNNDSESHSIFRTWYEVNRQRTNTFINNFITTMSDQTRNPLAAMRVAIQLLRTRNLSSEMKDQYLGILNEEWQKLNDINNKILVFKKLSTHELSFHNRKVDLEALMRTLNEERIAQSRSPIDPMLNIQRTDENEPLTLLTDPDHLRTILQELINNAEKFSLGEESPTITIAQQTIPEAQTEITISNLSNPIAQENLKYLFDPFFRDQVVVDSGLPGIGLGLAIVKGLVESLDGKITVTCTPRENSSDHITAFTLLFSVATD